jgi:hypothetical protein
LRHACFLTSERRTESLTDFASGILQALAGQPALLGDLAEAFTRLLACFYHLLADRSCSGAQALSNVAERAPLKTGGWENGGHHSSSR